MVDRPAPEAIRGMKIFITGANGFIGNRLMNRLTELGAEVSGVDLRPDPQRNVVEGSTADPSRWADRLQGVDVIIHMAAIVSTVAPLDQAWNVNVLGTQKVLQAARKAGVRRFVQVSSVAVYGYKFDKKVTEDDAPYVSGGSSTYTDTKINGDLVVMSAHAAGEIEVVIVRPGDVYGPGSVWVRDPIAQAKANQMLLPNGGKGMMDLIYVDNLVDGFVLVAATEGIGGQIFNLSEEMELTVHDYFGEIASWVGASARSIPANVARPLLTVVGGVQRKLGKQNELGAGLVNMFSRSAVMSNQKARDMLGFAPVVPYAEGMVRCKDWAQQQGLLD